MSRWQGSSQSDTVRPRLVWVGTTVALVGAGVVGVGVAMASWAWAAPGLVVLVAGALLAAAAGVMYDVRTSRTTEDEVHDVRTGNVHEGVEPGQMLEQPAARKGAMDTGDQVERRLHDTHESPRRDRGPAAAAVLAVVAVVLFCSQLGLVSQDVTGRINAFRITAAVIVLGLAAVSLALARRPGLATIATLVVGVALIANGVLADHHNEALALMEVLCGTVTILASVAVLGSRRGARTR